MKLLPNKIQLDILKRHAGPFLFCFFTVMFLLLMQFLILYIDKLIGKGLPLGVIIELILTNLAYMVVLAAPMAVLVSSLMAYGKFTELNELTALRAAGINPIHTINPMLAAGLILSVFLMWFSNDVLPDSNQRARALFMDIRMKKPGFDLQEGEFYDGIDGYTFLVQEMTHDSDSLHNITLFQEPTSSQQRAVIKAQRGNLATSGNQTMTLYLYDGTVLRHVNRKNDGNRTTVLEETAFNKYRISFDLSKMAFRRSNPNEHSRSDRTMDVQAMMAVVDTLQHDIHKDKQDVYQKLSIIVSAAALEEPLPNPLIIEADSTPDTRPSRYLVLEDAPSQAVQRQLYQSTLAEFRSYSSSFQNLQTNVSWRVGRIARYMVEIHKKFSIPLACFIFVMIGAPIGMYTKKGNLGHAALVGAGFLIFFWISIIQGEKLADRLYISPFTGMWFSNILLSIIGGYLVLRTCTSFRISNLWKRHD